MRYIILPFIIATIVFSMIACQPHKYKSVLDSMDSLDAKLDSLHEEIEDVDSVQLSRYYNEVDENLNLIKRFYKDTMDDELSIFLSDYRSLKKVFSHYISEKGELIENIEFSKSQLTDLKKDISNDRLSRDTIMDYYKSEHEPDRALIEEQSKMIKELKDKIKFFESSNPKVLEIIEKAKKDNKK